MYCKCITGCAVVGVGVVGVVENLVAGAIDAGEAVIL